MEQVSDLIKAINELSVEDMDAFDTCDSSIQTDLIDFDLSQFREFKFQNYEAASYEKLTNIGMLMEFND